MLFTNWELSIATTATCSNCKWTTAKVVPKVVHTSCGAREQKRVREDPENEVGLERLVYGVRAVNYKE